MDKETLDAIGARAANSWNSAAYAIHQTWWGMILVFVTVFKVLLLGCTLLLAAVSYAFEMAEDEVRSQYEEAKKNDVSASSDNGVENFQLPGCTDVGVSE